MLLLDRTPKTKHTWGSCGLRSWMLYFTQAITALKTCSSLRTLSSSLEMMSINWLAGSSMNSSLSITYDDRQTESYIPILLNHFSVIITRLTHFLSLSILSSQLTLISFTGHLLSKVKASAWKNSITKISKQNDPLYFFYLHYATNNICCPPDSC